MEVCAQVSLPYPLTGSEKRTALPALNYPSLCRDYPLFFVAKDNYPVIFAITTQNRLLHTRLVNTFPFSVFAFSLSWQTLFLCLISSLYEMWLKRSVNDFFPVFC